MNIMYKRFVLFAFSILLHQGLLFAQSIYSEGGVNTWTRIKYSHDNAPNYTSGHLSSRSRNGLGVRKMLYKKIAPIDPMDPIDPIDPLDPIDPIDPIGPIDPIDPSGPD